MLFKTTCSTCSSLLTRCASYCSLLRYPSARFVKVVVSSDELDEIASGAGVTSMPTFHVYRHGRREYCVAGADRSQLEAVVRRAVAFLT